jgi:hypothetical protein
MDAEKFQLKNVSCFGGLRPKKSSNVFVCVVKWLSVKPALLRPPRENRTIIFRVAALGVDIPYIQVCEIDVHREHVTYNCKIPTFRRSGLYEKKELPKWIDLMEGSREWKTRN